MPRTVITPVYASAVDQCDWSGCGRRPVYRVAQQDEQTGDELDTPRFFCAEHAVLVDTMATEAERRQQWPQEGKAGSLPPELEP